MNRSLLSLLSFAILLACGGSNNSTSPDASRSCPTDGGPACTSACIATLVGNLDASSTSIDNCAQVMTGSGSAASDTILSFALPAAQLDAPLSISIDLGASPSAGTFSSETSANWSALASRLAPATGSDVSGECVYSAGARGVPTGSFAMTLTAIGTGMAHGELRVTQYLQAQPQVDCGSGDTETVDVRF